MAEKLQFDLVSPEEILISEAVDMVVVPGGDGDYGVLPRHAPMITTVRVGTIAVYEGRTVRERIFVAGGFAEVTPAGLTLLAEEAARVDSIDRAAVEQALKDAKEDLADAKDEQHRTEASRRVALNEAKLKALAH